MSKGRSDSVRRGLAAQDAGHDMRDLIESNPLYIAEFQFRYNIRLNADIFGAAIWNAQFHMRPTILQRGPITSAESEPTNSFGFRRGMESH